MKVFKKILLYSTTLMIVAFILILFGLNKNTTIITDNQQDSFAQSSQEQSINQRQLLAQAKDFDFQFFLNNDNKELNSVSADAYIVVDLDSGETFLQKNPDKVRSIASITKLMTGLTSLESIDQLSYINVDSKSLNTPYGHNGGFSLGQRIEVRQLLYPMIMQSSNSAAELIARSVDRDQFINEMNTKTEKLNMNNTYFDDPSGLSAENKSTAKDLIKLLSYLLDDQKDVLEISARQNRAIGGFSWSNYSRFLNDDRYQGGKTGYTNAAGRTFAGIFELSSDNDVEPDNLGIVLLESENLFADTRSIIDYLENNIYEN